VETFVRTEEDRRAKRPVTIEGMGVPMEKTVVEVEKLRRHAVTHGLLSLAFTAFSFFVMRGFDFKTLFFFGFPTLLALVHARAGKSRVAEAFLVSIGVASVVALIPQLFPHLGGFENHTPRNHNDRLAMLYSFIYFGWIVIVLPIHLFWGGLRARKEGKPAMFSVFTCRFGIFATWFIWFVVLISLPKIIEGSGIWPLF
jgi:hypothetical protein